MSQLTRKAIMKCTLELAEKKSLKKITVKDIADECGITRSTFYYHFSDIYDVLQSIENMLITNCEERNKAFVYYRFKKDDYRKAGHFRPTLLYIKENDFWFRTLLNKSKDGLFIYKWKKVIKQDFLKKFRYEKIDIKEEELVLEMISSGSIVTI